jgi:polyisoprenoid-binding protein YceI
MDNNAYKALKADKNPNITADLKSAKVTTKDNVNYTVQATVILTIAGKAKETDMTATLKKINVDSYSVSAKKKINMVEYGVEPPSFMMGTVTTGKDVDLSFNFILNK